MSQDGSEGRTKSGPAPKGSTSSGHNAEAPQGECSRSPEHERLQVFIGKWAVEGRNAPAAGGGDGDRALGSVSYEWLPGGFFVVCHWDRQFGAELKRHAGLGVIGFEPESAAFFAQNFDNLGYERRYRLEAYGRTWKFVGRLERASLTFSDDGQAFSERWELSQDGANWQPLCELEAKKLG